MLDQNDIKKIGEEMGKVIEQNVTPVLDKLIERADKVEGRLDDMQKTIANLPDKAYLDAKIADLDGKVVVREKKLDQKVNLVVDALDEQHIVREDMVKTIKAIHVFPPAPLVQ